MISDTFRLVYMATKVQITCLIKFKNTSEKTELNGLTPRLTTISKTDLLRKHI